jgi:ABC-type transport system substrate-binding protein
MNFSFRHSFALAAVACVGLAMAPAADAKTFKWANSGDVSSMDPYARQETFLLTFTQNIYDPLVRRGKDLKLEPALATKWGQSDPTTWFFDIRPNVKFQDGNMRAAADMALHDENAGTLVLTPTTGSRLSRTATITDAPARTKGYALREGNRLWMAGETTRQSVTMPQKAVSASAAVVVEAPSSLVISS